MGNRLTTKPAPPSVYDIDDDQLVVTIGGGQFFFLEANEWRSWTDTINDNNPALIANSTVVPGAFDLRLSHGTLTAAPMTVEELQEMCETNGVDFQENLPPSFDRNRDPEHYTVLQILRFVSCQQADDEEAQPPPPTKPWFNFAWKRVEDTTTNSNDQFQSASDAEPPPPPVTPTLEEQSPTQSPPPTPVGETAVATPPKRQRKAPRTPKSTAKRKAPPTPTKRKRAAAEKLVSS